MIQHYLNRFKSGCAILLWMFLATGCMASGTMYLGAAQNLAEDDGTTDGGADDGGDDAPATLTSSSDPFPADMGFASPTERTAEGETVDGSGQRDRIATMLDPDDIADCAVEFSLDAALTNDGCYGPNINYTNHPDSGVASTNGQLPGGDFGFAMSTGAGSTQSCATAQFNRVMDSVSTQMGSVLETMAGLICIAKVNGIELPQDAGVRVDLTLAAIEAYDENDIDFDIEQAVIKREPEDIGEDPVFTMGFTGSTVDGQGRTRDVMIVMRHMPLEESGATYVGKVAFTISLNTNDKPGNCMMGALTGSTQAVSIAYERSSASEIVQEMRRAEFCGISPDPFVSADNFTVDLDKKFDAVLRPSGWGNNAHIAQFVYDPDSETGEYRYAWQAGMFDSHTRVLNLYITNTGTGKAHNGYGPQIASDVGVGSIDRMICNWAGPGNNHTGIAKAQQQTFMLNNTTHLYTPTSSNITYAPTNTCDTTGKNAFNQNFTYSTQDLSLNVNGTAVTNNLVPLSEIDMNPFVPPVDVDGDDQ